MLPVVIIGLPASPVECTGTVTRMRHISHTSIFGIATAFMEIDEDKEKMIEDFINEIQ